MKRFVWAAVVCASLVLTPAASLLVSLPAKADHRARPHWDEYNRAELHPYLETIENYQGELWMRFWVNYARRRPIIRVYLEGTGLTTRDERILERLAPPRIRLDVLGARFSWKQLTEFANIAARLCPIRTVPAIGYAEQKNGILVIFDRRDKRTIRALRRHIPRRGLIIKINPNFESGYVGGWG